MPVPQPHRIVILGAGFGGLRTALELLKRRVRLGNATITLIDAGEEHVYTPLLYEVAMGCLEQPEENASCTLRDCASLPFAKNPYLHRKDKKLAFKRGRVEGIDWTERFVRLAGGEQVGFDDLVLAVGGEAATFGVPGVAEHAVKMKTLEDAMVIRRRIAAALDDLEKNKRKCLNLVVVGAGPNGCEGAAELAFSIRRMVRERRIAPSCYTVTLADAGPEILGMFRPKTRALAMKRLAALGVVVKPNVKATAITPEGVTLASGLMSADVVVWAGGMKPRADVKAWGFPVDDKGFVLCDATFAVKDLPRVWALGDAALLKHPVTGARVPALAQAASKEAALLAENIVRIMDRKATINFVPPATWNTVVPLGGAWAVADLGAVHFTGWIGYGCRKAADLFYFLSVLPWRQAFKLWTCGLSGFARLG